MLWMMAIHPTPARRREARRMVAEKVAAACEGALAMQLESLRRARSLCVRALTGGITDGSLARAGRGILRAGTAPASRRVKANSRRLARRKKL
jgi:hypothetical protein